MAITTGAPPALRDFRAHYQALASITRLKILQFLAGVPDISVQELADAMDLSQPRLSWHLRFRRRAHSARSRRVGRVVSCPLTRGGLGAFPGEISSLMASCLRVGPLSDGR